MRETDFDVRQVLPRDAIPSVDDPRFVRATAATELPALAPDDDLVVVDRDGDVRGYPTRYLNFHEVVNDRIGAGTTPVDEGRERSAGGRPIAVTWCPLCGSSVVYDRRPAAGDPPDGVDAPATLTLAVSGKLADDDLVLYDGETGSEWKQTLGECISGPLLGAALAALAARRTSVKRFAAETPDGAVLAPPGGESEAAGAGDEPEPIDYAVDPYADYRESDGIGLAAHRGGDGRSWPRDDLDPKAVVCGVVVGDDALGFPRPTVAAAGTGPEDDPDPAGVGTATVGGVDVRVVLDDEGRLDAVRDAPDDGGGVDSDDREAAARDGDRLPTRRLYAFAWSDDHGHDAFYA